MPTPRNSARFSVPGEPQAWQRVGTSRNGKRYVPRETKDAKRLIGNAFKAENVGHELIETDVHLFMAFYTQNERTDWDNYGKLVSDALNKVAYHDDRQIVHVQIDVVRDTLEPETIVVLEWETVA